MISPITRRYHYGWNERITIGHIKGVVCIDFLHRYCATGEKVQISFISICTFTPNQWHYHVAIQPQNDIPTSLSVIGSATNHRRY